VNARVVIRRGLWTLGFLALWLPVWDDPPLETGAYLQHVGTDRATIAMVTAGDASRSVRVLDAQGTEVFASAVQPAGRRHRFEVAGLDPASRYSFSIFDGAGGALDGGVIRTPAVDDRAPVHFAVVGDSGGMPWWVWLQRSPLWHWPARLQWLPAASDVAGIGAALAAADPDFVLHVGDIVYPKGLQGHYSAGFFRPFAELVRKAPVYTVLGNHDVMEDEGRQALANFRPPVDSVTGDGRCYSVVWGAVRVIVTDFNWQQPGDTVADGHPGLVHLRRELKASTEPWVIVSSHYPIYSASRQRDRKDLIGQVLPLLDAHAVDLYFAGHDHTYQRFGGGEGDVGLVQIVSGGGGKSLYETREHPEMRVAVSQFHWCDVQVNGRTLVVRARNLEDEVLDTVELRHEVGSPRWQRLEAVNRPRADRIRAIGP
jgi:hypothetical protein